MNITLGSISTGTLRTEDLLNAVIGEVEYLFGSSASMDKTIKKAYKSAKAITDFDSDDAGYALDELIDALQYLAPPHVAFGMHPGDGADLGWWGGDFDGCDKTNIGWTRSHSLERTFIDTDCKLLVEINDHGNTTVKQLGGDVIWASV